MNLRYDSILLSEEPADNIQHDLEHIYRKYLTPN